MGSTDISISHIFVTDIYITYNCQLEDYERVCFWQTEQNNKPVCETRKSTRLLNRHFGTKWLWKVWDCPIRGSKQRPVAINWTRRPQPLACGWVWTRGSGSGVYLHRNQAGLAGVLCSCSWRWESWVWVVGLPGFPVLLFFFYEHERYFHSYLVFSIFLGKKKTPFCFKEHSFISKRGRLGSKAQ